jgi:peptidoglycan/LPS O-acetylase OafA/YrhL
MLNQDITLSKVLLNVTLLPTNYVFYPLSIDALKPVPIIPPAWSLATEFHFYLLLPLIFALNKKFWLLLLITTLGIQFSSFFFASGAFNSNNFGYRYIFGVLTVFLYGFAFAEKTDYFYRLVSILIWSAFTLFLLIIAPATNSWKNPLVQEILFGGFIALPLGYYFTTVKIQEKYKKIDNLLGDLAYPMFISHFLSFYLVEKILTIPGESRVVFYTSSITVCILISFLLSLLQKKVEIYRIKRRGFGSLKAIKNDSLTNKTHSDD